MSRPLNRSRSRRFAGDEPSKGPPCRDGRGRTVGVRSPGRRPDDAVAEDEVIELDTDHQGGGRDIDQRRDPHRQHCEVATMQSAYLIAAGQGYLDLLRLTLRSGAEVNDKDSWNGTGLIRAAERGHALVVGQLLHPL